MPDDIVAIYQRDSGILDANRCVATLAAEARRHGADVRENEPARQIGAAGAGVEVRTATASYFADRLVVTAGAWARPLLRQLGLDLPLTVTREQVAYFAPRSADAEPGMPISLRPVASRSLFTMTPKTLPRMASRSSACPASKSPIHQGGPLIEPESDQRAADLYNQRQRYTITCRAGFPARPASCCSAKPAATPTPPISISSSTGTPSTRRL